MTDVLSKYYDKAFVAAGEGGSIYIPMSVLERAGHDRKEHLLSELPLPDLSSLTVVDYGVGSWGFGCIFPKLKGCKVAIGVDISQYAIDCSKKCSENDPALSGATLQFITSNGYDIKLDYEVADVVFAGECIEHIEDTDAFLGEIWRILKPNGIAILTTPNARPYIYKQRRLKWAMGFEHVALMDSETLLKRLKPFFNIEVTKGYSSTIDPSVDPFVTDSDFAKEIAKLCENDFHKASGLIVQARKLGNERPRVNRNTVTHIIVESGSVKGNPGHRDLSLYEDTLGRMAIGDNAYLAIPIPRMALRCQLILWSHPWSGIGSIETSTMTQAIDLYSPVSGCARISLEQPDLRTSDAIRVAATGQKSELSQGYEVIFFRAVFSLSSEIA